MLFHVAYAMFGDGGLLQAKSPAEDCGYRDSEGPGKTALRQ